MSRGIVISQDLEVEVACFMSNFLDVTGTVEEK